MEKRKKICISLPCRNEEENIIPLTEAIINQFEQFLPEYDYLIQFIDNDSTDNTRKIIKELCYSNTRIRAIFNAGNYRGSGYHGILNAEGDAVIAMVSDFQDPPELIPQFVKKWEEGASVVCGVKTSSEERKAMWVIRSAYYSLISRLSDIKQIRHFTGFGLYDKRFLDILRDMDDPLPSMRGYVAEFCPDYAKVEFRQPKRKNGRTKNNFFALFDTAMLNLTTYTKSGLRIATFFGVILSVVSVVIGLIYLILKLTHWDSFSAGMAPLLLGTFLLGGIQLLFIGFLGEYIMNINTRLRKRPLIIEKERINF